MSENEKTSEVDDLVNLMKTDGNLTESTVSEEHPRFSDYKNYGKLEVKQRRRRDEFLDSQRNRREEVFLKAREMLDDEVEDVEEEVMETDETNAFRQHSRRTYKLNKKYQDQLMFSEWLIDIPNELHESWAMMPCPEGKRVLVVAKDEYTRIFNKAGLCLQTGKTGLSGGGPNNRHGMTILDCIRSKDNPKHFYILDLLYGQGMSFVEVDAVTRFANVRALFEEIQINQNQMKKQNHFQFFVPPLCRCTKVEMESMMKTEFDFELDGLLFYNDQGFYTAGYTPLVGWLKPWMMPEVLKIPILDKYKKESTNQSLKEYINEYNETHNHRFVHGKPWEQHESENAESNVEVEIS